MNLKQFIRVSISNHYIGLIAVYFIEGLRDIFALKDWIFSIFNSSFFLSNIDSFEKILTKAVGETQLNSLFSLNENILLASAVLLTFEKLYLFVTKFPRASYKGPIGSNVNRWIKYHWISIVLIILLKKGAEQNYSFLSKNIGDTRYIRLFCTSLLIFEAVYGLFNKLYIFYRRYTLNNRRKNK